jgi:uncharacterized protein YdeI (YjbR/CyaY-like superfamily)
MPAARSNKKTPDKRTPATKTFAAKTFSAVLERMEGNLGWVIIRIPFDAAKLWGKRGQLRVQGDINGFGFSGNLFPNGKGGHFLLVNKKMQKGGKTAAGLKAKFTLQPDTEPKEITTPKELLSELGQSKRLLKFFESLKGSVRSWFVNMVVAPKSPEARVRRARQLAEVLMETMEAEKDLPPMIELAFRQNPRAREKWEQVTPTFRRGNLLAIFYYRTPESRAKRLNKCIAELLGKKDSEAAEGEEEF